MKHWLRGIGNRRPLLLAALAAAAAVVSTEASIWLGIIVVSVIAAAGWWGGGRKTATLLAGCALLAAGSHAWRLHRQQAATRGLLEAGSARAAGILTGDARGSNGRWEALVKLRGGPFPGAKVWWRGTGGPPVSGAMVRAAGVFAKLPAPRNEGAFDEGAWLRKRGATTVFNAAWNPNEIHIGKSAALAAETRRRFRASVTAGLPPDSPAAAIIRAVVVGETPKDADTLVDAFRRSGTLHVFSVSGLHVAMVAAIGWFFLKWCGVSRRAAIPLLLALVFSYSWITGNSAPAVRSAWMTALFLAAFFLRRRPDLLNALGAVLLAAALLDGNLLFHPGVQLSYGVVAAIAAGTLLTARWFSGIGKRDEFLPVELMKPAARWWWHARRKTADYLAVSVAAAAGSAPLTAWHFGMAAPVSILAGAVILPIVSLMLAAGMFSAIAHPVFPPLAEAANHANAALARLALRGAEIFAAVPGGNFRTTRQPPPALRIYDLPHGAGAACFSAGGASALIDCGGRASFRYEVLPSLRQLGLEPDSIVLSHPDGGHLGGGSQVWTALPVKQALLPVAHARSPAFREWRESERTGRVKCFAAAAIGSLPLADAARLEILHAPEDTGNPRAHGPADLRVAVFRLHWRGWRFLFTSDAGISTEEKLLAARRDLAADIIIAGSSDERISLTPSFLDAVRPRVIIIGSPHAPGAVSAGDPRPAYWRSRGIHVIPQESSGGVTITPEPSGALVFTGFSDASRFTLLPASHSAAGASPSPPPPTGAGNPSSDKKTNPLPTPPR